jgi:quercetin dioxygenase-like cupin family protein
MALNATHSIPFRTTDWAHVPVTEHAGEAGKALWRTIHFEGFRMRMVEYSPGYKADHWCAKGQIVYCIEGEMTSELADGRTFVLKPGMTYTVTDGAASLHRATTQTGTRLLIIDGNFLQRKKREHAFNPWKM